MNEGSGTCTLLKPYPFDTHFTMVLYRTTHLTKGEGGQELPGPPKCKASSITIYIAKRLVVVVVSSIQVAKPLSRLAVVHSEVLH